MANFKNIIRFGAASLFFLALASCSDIKYEDAPYVAPATNVQAGVDGRSVTLNWKLPAGDITDVLIIRNADFNTTITLPGDATSYTLKGQPMDEELTYTVKVRYADGHLSEGTSVNVLVPYIEPVPAFLLIGATSPADLQDDDERAAAEWFATLPSHKFITPAELKDLKPDYNPVLWIAVDRVGQPMGWENLPAEIISADAIASLKRYSQDGGSLYLSTFATQLTVPLGFVPSDWAPTVYGNGEGGSGDDVWVINPHLGVDFQNGGDQGYYDRAEHAIFKGITLEDPNNYGYSTVPLIGPGQREDHNCLWDCNIYGKGDEKDVIRNFEVKTNSLVLATWGHVRDHCVAGLVSFNATAEHGRCVAMGLAAYEWNQNSAPNIYQKNVEKLTENILEYLK